MASPGETAAWSLLTVVVKQCSFFQSLCLSAPQYSFSSASMMGSTILESIAALYPAMVVVTRCAKLTLVVAWMGQEFFHLTKSSPLVNFLTGVFSDDAVTVEGDAVLVVDTICGGELLKSLISAMTASKPLVVVSGDGSSVRELSSSLSTSVIGGAGCVPPYILLGEDDVSISSILVPKTIRVSNLELLFSDALRLIELRKRCVRYRGCCRPVATGGTPAVAVRA
eukprot:5004778-Ditylum_brightwellii.AAC.1